MKLCLFCVRERFEIEQWKPGLAGNRYLIETRGQSDIHFINHAYFSSSSRTYCNKGRLSKGNNCLTNELQMPGRYAYSDTRNIS
jgi:hypothetical protein